MVSYTKKKKKKSKGRETIIWKTDRQKKIKNKNISRLSKQNPSHMLK